jgi:hypothetical protein
MGPHTRWGSRIARRAYARPPAARLILTMGPKAHPQRVGGR